MKGATFACVKPYPRNRNPSLPPETFSQMRQTAPSLDLPVPFTVGSGYAFQALAVMPEDGAYRSAPVLTALLQLPGPSLSKVLKALAQGGILQSLRGPRGGFRLARPAHCVTLKDVLDALKGAGPHARCQLGSTLCDCGGNPCVLHQALEDLKGYMEGALFRITIRDLQIQHLRHLRALTAAPLLGGRIRKNRPARPPHPKNAPVAPPPIQFPTYRHPPPWR